jgi:hypothetical protein
MKTDNERARSAKHLPTLTLPLKGGGEGTQRLVPHGVIVDA